MHASRIFILTAVVITLSVIIFVLKSSNYNSSQTSVTHIARKNYFGAPTRGENNIVFIEASCVFDVLADISSIFLVNSRQVCVLESAARNNPDAKIFLMHTCPITSEIIEQSGPHVNQLLQYPNFFVWPVIASKFFLDSPLEEWFRRGALQRSYYPVLHAKDVLRLVTIWRFGGTYLDTDIIIKRSLSDLPRNFVDIDQNSMGNTVFKFDVDKVGQEFSLACLQEIKENFNGELPNHNGPALLTRLVEKRCGPVDFDADSPVNCGGLSILPKNYFPPLYFIYDILGMNIKTEIFDVMESSYGLHFWNDGSSFRDRNVSKVTPYLRMVSNSCPLVFPVMDKES